MQTVLIYILVVALLVRIAYHVCKFFIELFIRNYQKKVLNSLPQESKQGDFQRVLKSLKNNKVMSRIGEDGIYIRLAGNQNEAEAFTLEWAKVYSFDEGMRNISNYEKE
jgi:hypothetical protein